VTGRKAGVLAKNWHSYREQKREQNKDAEQRKGWNKKCSTLIVKGRERLTRRGLKRVTLKFYLKIRKRVNKLKRNGSLRGPLAQVGSIVKKRGKGTTLVRGGI